MGRQMIFLLRGTPEVCPGARADHKRPAGIREKTKNR
jgi:hypothetical protein